MNVEKFYKTSKKCLLFPYNNVIIRILNNAFVIESGLAATLNLHVKGILRRISTLKSKQNQEKL